MDGLVKKRIDSNGAITMTVEGQEITPMVEKEVDKGDQVLLETDEGTEPELVLYTIDQTPQWVNALLLGLQPPLYVYGVATTTITAETVGMRDIILRGQLLSTVLIVAAVATLLQTIFGNWALLEGESDVNQGGNTRTQSAPTGSAV